MKRRTLAKNLKVKELHAIYIRHTSKDGEGITAKGEIDTEQIYERVYIIKDAEAAKKLFSEEENWIAAADNRVAQFFRDYGVQHNFATIKETPIDKIIEEVNHTPKLAKIKDVASLEKYFNDTFFRKQGFTIGNLTKRAVLYGPDSKDIFQTKENLANKIAENAIQDEVNNQKIKDATASKKAWDEKKSITKDQVDFQKELYGSQGAAIKEATSGTFSNTPQVTHVVMSNDMNKNVIEAMQNVPTVIEFLKEQKPTETNKPVLQIANSSDKNKGKKTNNQTPTPDNGTAEPEEKGGEENG